MGYNSPKLMISASSVQTRHALSQPNQSPYTDEPVNVEPLLWLFHQRSEPHLSEKIGAGCRVIQLEIASQTGSNWQYELFLLNSLVDMIVESTRGVILDRK